MTQEQQEAGRALARVAELVARLREPGGCPWDQAQTKTSLSPFLVEEAYEAAEAVDTDGPAEAMTELGDLIFQAVMMTRLYEEEGLFSLADCLNHAADKMIRRHPHVFGQERVKDAREVKDLWGRIKAGEREENGQGLLESLPKAAPALVRAYRLGKRAAQVGFDWPDHHGVADKVNEELVELAQAPNQEEKTREFGDLLFAMVQWARHLGIKPEDALTGANRRFTRRFTHMEKTAARAGQALKGLNPAELDRLWEEAKKTEKDL